jgi:alpha-beta hydrolase superfamily lysophospholipase
MNMKLTEINIDVSRDLQFYTREWLPEHNPKAILLLIHGLSDHSGRFRQVAEAFVKEDYIFFAPDLRGNGLSPGKRGHFVSMEEMMEDIEALINYITKVHPGLPLFLYGQSMGGNLVLNFGLRNCNKIDGIIASSPWLKLVKKPPLVNRIAASVLNLIYPSMLFPDGLNAFDLCHDKEICDRYRNDTLVHGKISVRTYINLTKSGKGLMSNRHEFNVPVLILHGNADPITSYRASKQFAERSGSGCTYGEWDGLFHELHNEPQ